MPISPVLLQHWGDGRGTNTLSDSGSIELWSRDYDVFTWKHSISSMSTKSESALPKKGFAGEATCASRSVAIRAGDPSYNIAGVRANRPQRPSARGQRHAIREHHHFPLDLISGNARFEQLRTRASGTKTPTRAMRVTDPSRPPPARVATSAFTPRQRCRQDKLAGFFVCRSSLDAEEYL